MRKDPFGHIRVRVWPVEKHNESFMIFANMVDSIGEDIITDFSIKKLLNVAF